MLYVVATPIGNLGDFSPRGIEALKAANIIACEDTRRTRALLTHFGIPCPRLLSYREQTEQSGAEGLIPLLKQGLTVSLCSNAGYPGISDPGYRLISGAVDNGIAVEVIPGAGAVSTALLLSGLPTSSYTFKGFPPRRGGPLRSFFAQEKDLPHTLVIFESPMRIGHTLAAAREVLGDRRAAVCTELTKKFERVDRGFLSELAPKYENASVKGEVTIVIAGNNPKFARNEECGTTSETSKVAEG
jgi:16S rRNA (cytidine1402-2'-O)-methyltransferase